MIRMQVKDVLSQVNPDTNLGSVVYANSFIMVDDQEVYVNITHGVPNLQSWFTNLDHYENLPLEINTVKNLECGHLGEKRRLKDGIVVQNCHGLMPVKEEYADIFDDVILIGKLVFYENGFVFQDNKINTIALPYDHVKEMTFHVTKEWWLQITTQESDKSNLYVSELFPNNMHTEQTFYLKID